MSFNHKSRILAIDFEPYFQAQVLTELRERGHSISRATLHEVDYLEIFTNDATIIYLPSNNQIKKIEEFLQILQSYQIVTIGLSQSNKDNLQYQKHFPYLHFESLTDVVISRSFTEIADIVEERIVEL